MTPGRAGGQNTRAPVNIGLVVSSTRRSLHFHALRSDLVAVISANKTAIWDSTVCKTALLDEPVSVSPGWSTVVTATWSGRGSGAKCTSKKRDGRRRAPIRCRSARWAASRARRPSPSTAGAQADEDDGDDEADGQEHDEAADD